MFDSFAHYLSYGATDQQTARDLTGDYDGLLVPGTIAAFQSDGTRGFVLTLSASRQTQYVIDPRFPLFQQRLPAAKKSHEALAALLGSPDLVRKDRDPVPSDFTPDSIDAIAVRWLAFNGGYTDVSSKHFSKYAERLGETVIPERREGPAFILATYTMATAVADPWWRVATEMWQAHARQARVAGQWDRLVRVVAAASVDALPALVADCSEERLVIWVDSLDEMDSTARGEERLIAYGRAIRQAKAREVRLFALYGGFFAVLLERFGLVGSSHGIGYGEARAWRELPQSGPPPARFYLPRAHRYVSQDLALYLWRYARDLVACACEECNGGSPSALDYHALMRHSVRCRHTEIRDWLPMSTEEAARQLEEDAAAFEGALGALQMPRNLRRQAEMAHAQLRPWARALIEIGAS